MPVHGGRSGDDVRAGALERGDPRRGGVEPSSEADLARGGVGPSSEADLARGSVYPSSEANLARGGIRRATLAGCGGHQGRDRVVRVFQVCRLVRVLCFFAGFKRVSPGYLGDPHGCPRQQCC
jgi:hypothetical protein